MNYLFVSSPPPIFLLCFWLCVLQCLKNFLFFLIISLFFPFFLFCFLIFFFYFFFFFFFTLFCVHLLFVCLFVLATCGMWKFPGQGLNSSHSSDNANSLTPRPPGNFLRPSFKIQHSCYTP